jgi:aspartyl-tRNA(Asn)/glutamyl-tRNA(Gln) amidotransferase subunit A
MSHEFDRMSAIEMRRLIATKAISPVDLTMRALAKAEATQSSLNAFYRLLPEEAIAAAKAAEAAVLHGDSLGPIHGIPFSVKDLIAVKDVG